MRRSQINIIITICITLLAASIIQYVNKMEPLKNKKFFQFPLSVGQWHGKELQMPQWVYLGLETPYVFLRNYSSPQEKLPVNLSLVWFDDTNYAFHAPEACMENLMRNREEIPIQIANLGYHDVIKMIVDINNEKYVLFYFFDMDGFITTKQSMIRINSLWERMHLRRTSATFVRVMTPMGNNQEEATKILIKFLQDVYSILPAYTYTKEIASKG